MSSEIALVHDWLVAQRGGENVLLELARLFPQAPVYSLVHEPGSVHPDIETHPIHTSFIQNLPASPKHFRAYVPLFPWAVSQWDLRGYRRIVSTSHCVAKGIGLQKGQKHLAYIHSPMRYLWEQMPHYLPPGRWGRILQPWVEKCVYPWRLWDIRSAQRPTQLLANSAYSAQRILKLWGRTAEVVYPPVDVDFFEAALPASCHAASDASGAVPGAASGHAPGPGLRRQGYLAVGALVPYKRMDLAIALANMQRVPLTIVGEGPQRPMLERLAGATVSFAGQVSRKALRARYAQAAGLWLFGTEDFGIGPVEAMAAGCPVLAWGQGGLKESVVDQGPTPTGMLCHDLRLHALARALEAFEAAQDAGLFHPEILQQRARRFDRQTFVAGFLRAFHRL